MNNLEREQRLIFGILHERLSWLDMEKLSMHCVAACISQELLVDLIDGSGEAMHLNEAFTLLLVLTQLASMS